MRACLHYLIGAPLAWAGLSSTVMVVAVSLRKASDPSYSSIVGAKERAGVCINFHAYTCHLCKCDVIKREYSVTWNICRHIQRGCRTKPFRSGRAYGELVRDARVELREEVMCGVGGQGHCEPRPLERNRRVKWSETTVADLLLDKEPNGTVINYLLQNIVIVSSKHVCFCFF